MDGECLIRVREWPSPGLPDLWFVQVLVKVRRKQTGIAITVATTDLGDGGRSKGPAFSRLHWHPLMPQVSYRLVLCPSWKVPERRKCYKTPSHSRAASILCMCRVLTLTKGQPFPQEQRKTPGLLLCSVDVNHIANPQSPRVPRGGGAQGCLSPRCF